jgi:hypothetical protein
MSNPERDAAPAHIAANTKALEEQAADWRALHGAPSLACAPILIAPSDEEQAAAKHTAAINFDSSNAKVAALTAPKPLSTVEKIEAEVAAEKSVRDQYAAALANLERLKALKASQDAQ